MFALLVVTGAFVPGLVAAVYEEAKHWRKEGPKR